MSKSFLHSFDSGVCSLRISPLHSDVQSIGLLCTVDLFPVPSSVLPGHAEVSGLNVLSSSHHSPYIASSQSDASAFPGYNHPPGNHNYSVPMPPPIHITVPQQPHDQVAHRPGPGYYSPANTTWDIVAYAGTHPIIENSKCTNALVGQTFVQSYKVKYKGRMVLMFVFAVSATLILLTSLLNPAVVLSSRIWR